MLYLLMERYTMSLDEYLGTYIHSQEGRRLVDVQAIVQWVLQVSSAYLLSPTRHKCDSLGRVLLQGRAGRQQQGYLIINWLALLEDTLMSAVMWPAWLAAGPLLS